VRLLPVITVDEYLMFPLCPSLPNIALARAGTPATLGAPITASIAPAPRMSQQSLIHIKYVIVNSSPGYMAPGPPLMCVDIRQLS
jgi:hypothetical protein